MSTQDDVRRRALELPGAEESTDGFGFSVMNGSKLRAFAWAWRDRALVREFEELSAITIVLLEQQLNELQVDRLAACKIHRRGLSVCPFSQAYAESPV